jgi:hypothetical protein
MAVSPSDTLRLTAEDAELVRQCEEQIDRQLSARTSDGAVVVIDCGPRLAITHELKKRYEAAGWSVMFTAFNNTTTFVFTPSLFGGS